MWKDLLKAEELLHMGRFVMSQKKKKREKFKYEMKNTFTDTKHRMRSRDERRELLQFIRV